MPNFANGQTVEQGKDAEFAMTYKQVCYCNLCDSEIAHPDQDGVIHAGGSQVWPIDEKEYDVCSSCLSVLLRARVIRIVQVDLAPLFVRAGYNSTGWVRKLDGLKKYASEPE